MIWTTKYINELPDSSFAIIESGYERGSAPQARHLPFRDADGKVSLPHLKNAWAKANQIKSALRNDTDNALRDKARKNLKPVYSKHIGLNKSFGDKGYLTPNEMTEFKISNRSFDTALCCDVYTMENVVHCAVREVDDEPGPTSLAPEHSAHVMAPTDTSNESDTVVRQKWRFLSAVKAWPHTNFPFPQMADYTVDNGEALKTGIDLINNDRPDLRWDHSDSARDVAGNIQDAEWEDASNIEAGINGYVVVDSEFDPKAAVGLRRGIIRAGSIGIKADMIRSHPDMPIQQFVRNQGKVIDNEEVRWVAVRIKSVDHMAILPAKEGADPNAGPRLQANENNVTHNVGHMRKIDEQARRNTEKGGHNLMTDSLFQHFGEVSDLLSIDWSLDDSAAPEELEKALGSVRNKVKALVDAKKTLLAYQGKLNSLERFVIQAEETGLRIEQILERLEERLEYSRHGQAFLDHQRKDAVQWFDKARVDPKADMSDNDKKIRGRIENSSDLEFVQEQLVFYKEIAEGRFGPLRSSTPEPINNEGAAPSKDQSPADEDIAAMFGVDKKE